MSPLFVFLLGCAEPPAPDTGGVSLAPGCGDGVISGDEACDAGVGNSDTAAGACRTDCSPARCGDGVVDPPEACDDGNPLGGDGCDDTCALENGALEVEPNDSPARATPGAALVHGSLALADVDCWSVEVSACGAFGVSQLGRDGAETCEAAVTLRAYGPDGVLRATGAPGADAGARACATLDPADQPNARWADAGTWAVCVEGVRGAAVPSYALAMSAGPSTGLPATGEDLDGDRTPDSCDPDDDGDGVDDTEDDCPGVPNGPLSGATPLGGAGFVRTWLAVGPFTTGASSGGCRPSEDPLAGEDAYAIDASWAPSLGEDAGGLTWTVQALATDAFDMLLPARAAGGTWSSVPAPREGYAFVRVVNPGPERPVTLAVGADDGVFAWWNGVRVLDVADCQGVNADQFRADVTLRAGDNDLLLKVRDQGGGWGVAARLLGADGAPVTELAVLPGATAPTQGDRDGDGIGDACDPVP